jgi:acetyl-CoA carboxylase carboxyltransferase component
MSALRSGLEVRSPSFDVAAARARELLDEVERAAADVLAGGSEASVARHRERGRLGIRERIDLLVDEDSPILELSTLAGWGTDDPIGGGIVSCLGVVEDTLCVIFGNDPTVRGGSLSPSAVRKQLRALEIAEQNRLPVITLTESGGADLPKQADIFVPGGETFRRLTQLSAAGIPVVTIVFGSATAGGAYMPGLSDWTILVQGQAKVFLGGPPLVKMAINEDVDDETLGGAEMHATVSGLADQLAVSEADALGQCRRILRRIGWRGTAAPPFEPTAPRFDAEELLGVVPADPRTPFDVRTILARTIDDSDLDEFKPLYGTQLVCGWARLCGFPIGVLANNGILFGEEAQKGAHFIQLANRLHVPLLFVQNITGFMVGSRYERAGIIKDGAKLINAVSNSTVPHVTLMVGASYGAGNYAMSGRAYQPRFVFTWPNHRIAVMGPSQLAGVMSIVTKGSDPDAIVALEEQVERESTALFATGQLWDDGIIDPRDTRTALGIAFAAATSAGVEGTSTFGVFRM